MVRVFLVDDHIMLREGLKLILQSHDDIEIVGEADSAEDAIGLLAELRPDVSVIDLLLPEMSGIQLIENVISHKINTKCLILSMYGDETSVRDAMAAGAYGYILKGSDSNVLVHGIRQVALGQKFLGPMVADKAIDAMLRGTLADSDRKKPDILTARELEVLVLVAEGNTNYNIATILKISPRTVETHRANLQRKLGITSQVELVKYAIKNGLISSGK